MPNASYERELHVALDRALPKTTKRPAKVQHLREHPSHHFTIFLLIAAFFLLIWGRQFETVWFPIICSIAAGVCFLGGCARLFAHDRGFASVTAWFSILRMR